MPHFDLMWDAPAAGPPDKSRVYLGPRPGEETALPDIDGTQATLTITGAIPASFASYVTAIKNGVESAPTNEVFYMATETIKPIFASGAASADGLSVAVTLLEADSPPILPAAAVAGFGIQVNGAARTISSATAAGLVVTLVLAAAVFAGDVVTVTYAPGNVTDSATAPNAMLAFTAQPVANASALRNPQAAEIATALRGAQIALETSPGVLPNNAVYKRLTQSQLVAKPNVAAKPYTPMGMKGISVVQQGTEVTDYDLSGVMSYTELPYWLEAALNKSAVPVAVGTKAWTRTYFVDSRLGSLLPQTYNVQTGSNQGADQAAFVFCKDLQLKTTKDEASMSGSLVGFPLADGVALITAGVIDVKKAPVDANTIGVYLGDDPALMKRLIGSITSDWMLGGHWHQTDYQNDLNPAYDSLVEMVPAFGVKIVAAPSAQEQMLLTRLRTGQSIYVGYRSRGAIIEGAPGNIISQYGLDIIMPTKVTKTPSRGDKDGVFAHDYEFGAADDPTYGLIKIVVTTDIANL